MYRPGEEVHAVIVRQIGHGPEGDVSMEGLTGAPVTYQVMDPQGNLLNEGKVELSNLGGSACVYLAGQQQPGLRLDPVCGAERGQRL